MELEEAILEYYGYFLFNDDLATFLNEEKGFQGLTGQAISEFIQENFNLKKELSLCLYHNHKDFILVQLL